MRPALGYFCFVGTVAFGCASGAGSSAAQLDPPPADWKAPQTQLPKVVVTATDFLLHHGLGDPRGGKAVEAEVKGGYPWNGSDKPLPMKGWLLPDKKRFAGIDGLVYTPVSVKKEISEADMAADATSLDRRWPTSQPSLSPLIFGSMNRNPLTSLLLLHGDVGLAEKCWAPLGSTQVTLGSLIRPYVVNRFQRAVAEHIRGEDRLALQDAASLQRDRNAFETAAADTLVPSSRLDATKPNPPEKALAFLSQLDALVEDSRRRVDHPRKTQPDLVSILKLPSQQRIAALIEALDEIGGREESQWMGSEPTVQALVKEGNAAGDALLDCAERDKRLTRSANFGRMAFMSERRDIATVRDAALTAFHQIVQGDTSASFGTEVSIPELREYWAKSKGMTPAERWYQTLEDDHLTARQWLNASNRIVSFPRQENKANLAPARMNEMRGENLRTKTNPSVADLLAKRALGAAQQDPASGNIQWFDVNTGMELALNLAKWDGRASLPTLAAVTKQAMDQSTKSTYGGGLGQFGLGLGQVLHKRVELGDSKALSEYAEWLPKVIDLQDGRRAMDIYYPLVKHRNDPVMHRLARRLFLDSSSPFLTVQNAETSRRKEMMVTTPLLMVPEARQAVIQQLKDRTVDGKIWREGKVIHVEATSWTGTFGPDPKFLADPLVTAEGDEHEWRRCDRVAMLLRNLRMLPKFQPYWPMAAKEKAISKLISVLQRPGFSVPYGSFSGCRWDSLRP